VKTKSTLAQRLGIAAALAALPGAAHASLFEGETLDAVANGVAWVVLLVVPVVGIAAFWLVHILPEKIAEKKKHPQTAAIQVLCLLSLVFGGLLWPLAWLWAYTRPVLYKMAYGEDEVEHGAHDDSEPPGDDDTQSTFPENDVKKLRARVAELEARLARTAPQAKGV
jgi:CBS domain containing-hemolysin-like protein